ncbi:GntR family transcriptional regulator [Rhodococcus rhodnii]|uniref:GntR family transcriptional regulator n=1 Tax=Rhodococcus rhodnii LMG 5362 TaxID=1273125 RepID=R7WIP2_9NOCA|nr:GntR family transcriptional regulator [Rhodococcus rhodnii]EOM75102.1 GntR family transcriptional regulator [Rhodococcus rhodnii LMG 5362]
MYVDATTAGQGEKSRRGDAVDRIHHVIRERIVSGEIRPGVALSQVRLATELQVSRTPLREALRRLEAENLVVNQANRGVVVAPVALGDVEDSYAIRTLVEPSLLTATLETISQDDITAMSTALMRMKEAAVTPRDFQLAHWDFHRIILDRFPPGIRSMIESHLTIIDRYQRMYFQKPAAAEDLTSVDEILLDAVRCGDAALAQRLLEFHLLDTALGVITAAEPTHRFGSLPIALAGVGIHLGSGDELEPRHLENALPLGIRWSRGSGPDPAVLPALRTTNLCTDAPCTTRHSPKD